MFKLNMIIVNIPTFEGIKSLQIDENNYKSLFSEWCDKVLSLCTAELPKQEVNRLIGFAELDPNRFISALVSYVAYGNFITEMDYHTFRYDRKIFADELPSFSNMLLDSGCAIEFGDSIMLLPEKEMSEKYAKANSLSIDSIKEEALAFLDELWYYSSGDEKDPRMDLVLRPYREGDLINTDEILVEKGGSKWRFDVRRAYIESRIDTENMLR